MGLRGGARRRGEGARHPLAEGVGDVARPQRPVAGDALQAAIGVVAIGEGRRRPRIGNEVAGGIVGEAAGGGAARDHPTQPVRRGIDDMGVDDAVMAVRDAVAREVVAVGLAPIGTGRRGEAARQAVGEGLVIGGLGRIDAGDVDAVVAAIGARPLDVAPAPERDGGKLVVVFYSTLRGMIGSLQLNKCLKWFECSIIAYSSFTSFVSFIAFVRVVTYVVLNEGGQHLCRQSLKG